MSYGSSASDRLTAVRTAIQAILDGAQSYTVLGQQFNRATLGTLYRMETQLMAEVDATARTRPVTSYAKCRKEF